jgi:hypothetical protein
VLYEGHVHNRGPEQAPIHVLPQLVFATPWSWGLRTPGRSPSSVAGEGGEIVARHPVLGTYWLYVEEDASILFTENETTCAGCTGWTSTEPGPSRTPFHEDDRATAFRPALVSPSASERRAAAPRARGAGGGSIVVRVRLTDQYHRATLR